MEPVTVTALRTRIEDLKSLLEQQRVMVLRIVESFEEPGSDISYQIKERLEEYFNTGS